MARSIKQRLPLKLAIMLFVCNGVFPLPIRCPSPPSHLPLHPREHRSVALYYCNRPALSLRCFRLALVLRQQILQNTEQHIRETETRCSIGINDDFTKGTPRYGAQHSDTVAAEAGEAAAAISLNNIGVCLAGTRKTGPATQALLVSSRITKWV